MKKILGKVLGEIGFLFKQTWFLSLLFLLILSAVIIAWGEYVAIAERFIMESLKVRIIVASSLIISWALIFIILKILAKRKKKQEQEEQQAQGEKNKKQEIIEVYRKLSERLSQAFITIKSAGLHGRLNEKSKYQLPWYMVIGPSESGKTTLLESSGLDFPLNPSTGKFTRDIQKTLYCEWYFANHAILIDSGGRFYDDAITKEKDGTQAIQADQQAWMMFLKKLRQNRRRRPLNGIIFTLDINQLLSDDELFINNLAKYARERLQKQKKIT